MKLVKTILKKFKNSSTLYYIKRLRRLKNNEVYLISRAYIPIEIIGKNTPKNIFKDKNLLDVLINKFGIRIIKSEQEVSAITLDKNDSILFKTQKGYPAISNTWFMYDNANNLVLIDQEYTIRPIKVENNYQ